MYCYSCCVFILIRIPLTFLLGGTLTPLSQHPLLYTLQVCCLSQLFLSLPFTGCVIFLCVADSDNGV